MSDHQDRPHSSGPAIVVIVIFLIAALIGGAFAVVYRQARQAREVARTHEAIAQQREQEVRQLAQMQMKQLADLEEKETGTNPDRAADDQAIGGLPPVSPVNPTPPDLTTLNSELADLHTQLGEVELKAGNRKKAVEHFQSALDALKKAYGENDSRTRDAEDRLKKAEGPGG